MDQEILTEKEYKLQWGDMQRTMAKKTEELKKNPVPRAPQWAKTTMSSLSHISDEDYKRIFGHL